MNDDTRPGPDEITPTVSVCLQTYQHAPYIRQAIDSVLMQQTDFEWELLIGEDESTDGTREICIEYAKKHPQIRLALNSRKDVIRIKGRATGRYNFLNNLYRARGKYIAILPGDDYWTNPHKLQKQVEVLESHPDVVACHHWYTRVYEGGIEGPEDPRQGYCPQTLTELRDIFANRVRIKSRTVMFRNVLDEDFFPPWYKQVLYGDVPLSLLLGAHGNFYFIDEPMAVYRITGDGLSDSGNPRSQTLAGMTRITLSWVDIWRKADQHYNGRFHREARATILALYRGLLRQYFGWFRRRLCNKS